MQYGIGWKGECSTGIYEVIELHIDKIGRNIYDKVKFLGSNSEGLFARCNIKTGNIKDKYSATVYGIGILGNHKSLANVKNPIYNAWKSMIYRCKNDGDKLDRRWIYFSNFEADFYHIPFAKNYLNAFENGDMKRWALDKDCIGGVYGPNSVIYLPYEVNMLINQAPPLLRKMGAILPTKEQIINYIENSFEEMIR